MVRRPRFNAKAPQTTNENTTRLTNARWDDPETGSCPSYDYGMKRSDTSSEHERPVSRVELPESATDSSQDVPRSLRDVAQEERPEASLLSVLLAVTRDHDIDPTAVVSLDRAGNAWMATEAHPNPQKISQSMLGRELRTRLSDPNYDFGLGDPDAETDIDLADFLSESERTRNSPDAHRPGRNNPCSNGKRRKMNLATGAAKQNERNAQDQLVGGDEGDEDSELSEVDEFKSATTEVKRIRVDSLLEWYRSAFSSVSQLATKEMLKAWIKVCVPKKQSRNPYNGGHTAAQSMAYFPGYKGHFTMPDWWPEDEGWDHSGGATGCRHTEPDHIRMPERLILLMHLLRYGHQFDIESMKGSTSELHQKSPKEFPPRTMKRLEEIYWARQQEMRFEIGEIDGESTISLSIPLPKKKERGKGTASTTKNSASIKAESPQPEILVQPVVPAPVANMGSSLKAAQVEANDDHSGVSIAKKIEEHTDPSVLPDSASSVTGETTLEQINLLPMQQETGVPPHGLPTQAQTDQAPAFEPYESYGFRVGSSLSLSPRSDLTIVNQYRRFSEQAAREKGSMPRPEAAPPRHVPQFAVNQTAMFPQDTFAFTLPTSTARATHSSSRESPFRSQEMKVTRRPHRNHNPNSVARTQTQVTETDAPPRPTAPKTSTFAGSSSDFSVLDSMNPSFLNGNYFPQQESLPHSLIYSGGVDPHTVLTSSAGSSFSNDFIDSVGDGYYLDTRNQPFMPSEQEEQVETERYKAQYPTYISSSVSNIPSTEFGIPMYRYESGSMADASMGFEPKFNPFPPGPERRR